jgi:putative cell wall-binding protein
VRTLGIQDRSTQPIGARQRLAAGAALAVAATTAIVFGAGGVAFASSVTAVTGAATPPSAGATAQYAITFTATTALSKGIDTITIDEPDGTGTPAQANDYTVNGSLLLNNPVVSPGQNITLTTPVNIAAGSTVVIGAVHITNPPAGPQVLRIHTSKDATPAQNSTPYVITPPGGPQVTNVVAGILPTNAGSPATYTVSFKATDALTAGSGTITLTGPSGTDFPLAATNYVVNGVAVGATPTGSPGNVTITTPVTVASGANVTVQATSVTNPGSGVQTLTVATSSDTTFTASDFFTILPAAGSGGGGGGGAGGSGPSAPVRLFGADRFGTAIAASQAEFPTDGSAGAVVLARADDYPDALVGTALAAAKHAPLLFASGGTLTMPTQVELKRVLPAGGTVYLLGGTAAIPASVATAVTALGYVPVRYSGTDRFGTALAVANALGNPSTVLLATGVNFPDALAAGPAAAHTGGVVLLTDGTTLTASVKAYLAAHPGTVYAVGGPAVTADKSAIALSGADRYATATAVAAALFSGPANIGVASGTAFPDALSGGAFEAHFGGPIVLSDPNALPSSTSTYLTGSVSTIVTTTIFGGTAALSAGVAASISSALGLS